MAVRSFNGTSDLLTCSGTSEQPFNGGWAIIMIARPHTLAAGETYLSVRNGGTMLGHVSDGGGSQFGFYTSTTATEAGFTTATADVWQIMGLSKPNATGQGEIHDKTLGSGSWSQNSGGDSFGALTGAADRILIGGDGGAGNYKDFEIATLGMYRTFPSDAQIQTIQTTPATQTMKDLGASHLWDFNQAATGTTVLDLVGDWHQTAISGTSVVTGADPPSWTFGVTGGGAASPTAFIKWGGVLVPTVVHTKAGGVLYPPL
jgi:hypothetical protein